MDEFTLLQRMIEGLAADVRQARDGVIGLTARFDNLDSRHNDHERRLNGLETAVQELRGAKAEQGAVEAYQTQLDSSRREARRYRLATIIALAGTSLSLLYAAHAILG
jgi:ferric-dicitrate binding protein FerR (iron transport regulator)